MKKSLYFTQWIVLFLSIFSLYGSELGAEELKPKAKASIPVRPVPPPFEERLFQDWLKQDSSGHSESCFVDSTGNGTESKLIEQVLKSIDPAKRSPFEKDRQALLVRNLPGSDPKWRSLYENLCRVRRTDRLNMIAEFSPEWIYTKHYVIGASFYAYTEDASDEEYKDISRDRRNGGQLCKMKILPNGQIQHEILYEVKEGTIRDPDVSWDGKKILFSMRRHFTKDDFHLYEYDVPTKDLRQLTFGKGFADIEPVYLPNGDIMFTSTRCVQITDCWWTEVSNFFMIDSEGRSMRRVSHDQVSVNYPKVLNDGRVIYTRWDYNDRGQVFPQPLFVMNSDATGQTEYYGNNSWFPTSILHGRPIPDSGKIIAIASGHHTYQHGKLLLIDRSKGNQENQGCTLIAPVRDTPAEKIDQYGQTGELFQYPYAMDESNFLVTYLPEGRWKSRYPIPFGVYYMNADGQRELLAYDPAISCNQQVPLMPREKPVVRISQVDPKKKTGEFYVHNIYEGPGLKGIAKGKIKSLRVVALGFRTAGIQSNKNSGPAGAAMVSTPVSINNGSWDTKHVLGTVPVEEDGSAYFRVPASTPIYFQLLDENGDMVQTMRSWSTLQPGEFFACVGCHEPKVNTMINLGSLSSKALRKPPVDTLQKDLPKGIFQDGFSFNREIQPILDDHCIQCHTGGKKKDGAPAPFSLLGNEYKVNDQTDNAILVKGSSPPRLRGGRSFSEAYVNLTQCGKHSNPYIHWLSAQEGPQLLPPYFAGAALSPMMKMLRSGGDSNHKDVRLSDHDLRTIALWIDLLIPFCGDYKEAAIWTPRERAVYAYYEMKRKEMNRIIAANHDRVEKGRLSNRLPDLKDLEQFETGGPEYKAKFIDDYLKKPIPVIGKKSGSENIRRNLAINPKDLQGELVIYPHASANSEFRYLRTNAAINAIDGIRAKNASGIFDGTLPAWRPDLRTDLQLKIEFGQNVQMDQIVLQLDADFEKGPYWIKGDLVFSDGSREQISFKPIRDPQSFSFKKRISNSIQLSGLQFAPDRTGKSGNKYRPGIVELEVWGISAD